MRLKSGLLTHGVISPHDLLRFLAIMQNVDCSDTDHHNYVASQRYSSNFKDDLSTLTIIMRILFQSFTIR